MAPKSCPLPIVGLLLLLFLAATITTQFTAISAAAAATTSELKSKPESSTGAGPGLLSGKQEKLTHFRVYWHDVLSGSNPTSVPIIKPKTSSAGASGFGWTNVIDNALTETPDLKTSKLVGRAQGFYSMDSQEEVGLIMAMNFAFLEGKYNGSTITVMGRNMVMHKVREMPVVGGTGLFRFARGYVEARTHTFNPKTGDACVEYNCYVLHY